jgi:hypothetical protein
MKRIRKCLDGVERDVDKMEYLGSVVERVETAGDDASLHKMFMLYREDDNVHITTEVKLDREWGDDHV